jgi:hypothetical protein
MHTMKENMSLDDFIARMKAGWGFWRGGTVKRIGLALDAAFPPDGRNVTVTVAFRKGSYGSGPNFHYTYEWEVEGPIPSPSTSGTLPPSETDRLFGYLREQLPELAVTDAGFKVGYVW